MGRIRIIIRLLQRSIILGIVLLVCTKANALDLTGTWRGSCFNINFQEQSTIKADLIQKGNEVTGYLKVSKPLYGNGPIKGWIDIENKKFGAIIKCDQLTMKILMGGQTLYLENASIDIIEDLRTGRMIGIIKGDYRAKFGWAREQSGTFKITRTMQETFGSSATVEDPVYTTHYSNVYHRAGCPELGTEDLVQFESSQDARNAGGIPCKDCNP